MNHFIFVGNVGKDPELRTAGEHQVLTFSCAFKTGQKGKEVTTWVNCSLWNKRATSLQPYIKKGMQLTLGGEVWMRDWTTQDGRKGTSLEMNVTQLAFPPKPKEAAPAQQMAPPQEESDVGFGGPPF